MVLTSKVEPCTTSGRPTICPNLVSWLKTRSLAMQSLPCFRDKQVIWGKEPAWTSSTYVGTKCWGGASPRATSPRNMHDRISCYRSLSPPMDSATPKIKVDGSIMLFTVQSRVRCTSAHPPPPRPVTQRWEVQGRDDSTSALTSTLENTWLVACVCYFHGETAAPQDSIHPLGHGQSSSKLNLEIERPSAATACTSELGDGVSCHRGPHSSSSNQVDLKPVSATW